MANVLVTDGGERAALAIVRSLGARAHRVVVASESGRSLSGASRWAKRDQRLPSPLTSPDEFFEAMRALVDEESIDVVLPVTEATLRVTLPRRSELAPAKVPFASNDSFRAASDKRIVLERARALGIDEPTIFVADSPASLLAVTDDWEEGRFPVVLKATRSVVEDTGTFCRTSVRYATSRADLEHLATEIAEHEFPLLVQRKVGGPGAGAFFLVSEGRTVATFAHRRIREKPPSGGVSVLRESIVLPPSVMAASARLLGALKWDGVAMVEYKIDESSGAYVLMEINGRFWGSLQLAIDAGVDFPALLVDQALGTKSGPPPTYREGVRTRWFMGDVDHLLLRLFRSRERLGLDSDAPGRVRAAMDFLVAFSPAVRSEVFRLRDPGPSVREAGDWVRGLLGSNG